MKKLLRIIIAVLLVATIASVLAACSSSEVDYKNIESVTVDETSVAEGFMLSEFDISKVLLNVKYKDYKDENGNDKTGEIIQIPAALSMVKAEDKAKLSVAGTKNITLIYGKYEIQFSLTLFDDTNQNYFVTFYDEDGTRLGDPIAVLSGNRAPSPGLATKPGFTFVGWRDRDTGAMSSLDNIQKNVSLVAVYAPNVYEVGFYTKVGNITELIANVEVPRNADAQLHAPAIPILQGYSNGRWENPEAMKNINASGLKFFAIYDADSVKIGFNYKRYSSLSETEFVYYNVGSEILNPPSAERDGYKFVGWTVNDKKAEFPYTVKSEMVFTAKYVDIARGNDGMKYTKEVDGYVVSGFDGAETIAVIPEKISVGGQIFDVVGVAEGAFRKVNITEFAVSNTNSRFITENGVLFSADKKILIAYPNAKDQTNYEIPSTVEEIRGYAFYNATNLTDILASDGVKTIGKFAFSECVGLTNFFLPKTVIALEDGAFKVTNGYSNLATLEFSDAAVLESIGDEAFYGLNSLREIKIPGTVSTIGTRVFYGCRALAAIRIDNNPYFEVENGILYNKGKTTLYAYPAMYAGANSPDIVISENCERILSGAFSFAKISGLTVPSAVTFENNAVECPNLNYLLITAESIHACTQASFGSFPPLNIFIARSNTNYTEMVGVFGELVVDYIEDSFESARPYLENIIYKVKNYTQGGVSYQGISILGARRSEDILFIPSNLNNFPVIEIAENAFSHDSFVRELHLPSSLLIIGNKAFYGMSNLETVEFNGALEKVGDFAFAECVKLNNLENTAGIKKIASFGKSVFYNTPFTADIGTEFITFGNVLVRYVGFGTTVTVPAPVTYIASDAFSGKGEITKLNFEGENIQFIDYRAFQFCTGLQEISFPSSIKRIASEAFFGCSNLYQVFYNIRVGADGFTVTEDAFADAPNVHQIYREDEGFVYYALTYFVDSNDSSTVRGRVIVNPYVVDNTSKLQFAGWYTTKSHETLVTFPLVLTADTTIYAKWIALEESSAGLVYSLTDDGLYSVTAYNGTDSYVIVPSVYKNRKVVEVAESAFKNKSHVKQIHLPSTKNFEGDIISDIRLVGSDAFIGTAWFDQYSGDFVMIDDILIRYTGMSKEVRIPASVNKIAQGAFKNNKTLEKVVLPEGIARIDNSIFEDCTALTEVVLPKTLLEIGYKAFYNCTALKTINFSDSGSLYSVAYDAFEGTAWLENSVESCIMINNILYRYVGKDVTLHIFNGVTTVGERAFYQNKSLRNVFLPQSLVTIEKYAFAETLVSEVNIYARGSQLLAIQEGAFYNCTALSVIGLSLASSLEYIGDQAFYNCLSLRNVSIPAAVSEIGMGAFAKSGVNTLVFASKSNLAAIPDYAFDNCRALVSVVFNGESALNFIGDYAFNECVSLRDFKNESAALQSLGVRAFYNCTGLANFFINEKELSDIGSEALENVGYLSGGSSVNMVVLGNILVSYKGYDTVVEIPANITNIYNGAFEGNRNITEIIFPEDSAVTAINDRAFFGCSELGKINFPAGIEFVGNDVMTDTKWLSDRINDGEEYIIIVNTLVKYNGSYLKQVILPEQVEVVNSGAFDGKGVYDITVGAHVKRIEDGAFNVDTTQYAAWTLTLLSDTPAIMKETNLLSASKILVNSPDTLDTYRLDDGWSIQYEKMEAAVYYLVEFVIDNTQGLPLASEMRIALYDEIEIQTLTDGNKSYVFVGWFMDDTYLIPCQYPYILTTGIKLYAKCIDNSEGSNPDMYEVVETDTIALYQGTTDTKLIILGEHASSPMKKIGQGWVIDNINGTHINNNGSYELAPPNTPLDKWIRRGAFEGHTELREVYFTQETQIMEIGADAFKDCTNLTKIVIPSSVKMIRTGAFRDCTSLREVVFAEGSTGITIESGAFENCTSLISIVLPNNVFSLGDGAFRGCNNLVDITLNDIVAPVINESLPFEITVGLRIRIPKNSYNSYASAWAAYESYLVEREG